MGNIFALLGLRALFVLVEGLIRRFRYLDQTIAVVLALVGVKLLIEDVVHIGPIASLLIVFAAFAIGIVASLIADSRDPDADAKRAERSNRTEQTRAGRRARSRSPPRATEVASSSQKSGNGRSLDMRRLIASRRRWPGSWR